MLKTEDTLVCYAANASSGRGGQGEFLRQMVYALDQFPRGRILSRNSKAQRAECIDVPSGGWRKLAFDTIRGLPVLRRRHDWITLLSDVDFDSRLLGFLGGAGLFDGVMGQCCLTLQRLAKKQIPSVLTALNCHIDELADILADEYSRLRIPTRPFIHPRMRQRARTEIEHASRIRVISEFARLSFVKRGIKPERVEVVLPAVDLDHFRPVAKKDAVFRVLAVLTIDPRKGAFYLLQAFEKAAIPRSELVIIGATGDPWSRQMLAQFTSRNSNIRLQSADVVKEPIETTYGPASVFVHPAIEDGFALAVSQALACGKPVITTHQTGAAQLITEGDNGYVLNCRDVDGLVEHLRRLARDEALLNRMSAAAPRAVADLGYPSHADSVRQLYDHALARP
ncbi:MAG TPA: glycosyltransferase family 4 protein [Bryobacteraceae bacterium]|nr:glycosyltransferase family 4 protein [Bryobacteraceae bacterium]